VEKDIFPVLHPVRLFQEASLSVSLMACLRGNVYEPIKFSLPKSSSNTSIVISLFSSDDEIIRFAEKFHSGSRLFLTLCDFSSWSRNFIFKKGSDFPIISLLTSSDPLNTITLSRPGLIMGPSLSMSSKMSSSCSVSTNSLLISDCLPSDV